MNIAQDSELRTISDALYFDESENGLKKVVIDNEHAEAEIYLYGANMTHFQLKSGAPVIFNGKETLMSATKTVHAGIPICWPWFGAHPTESAKPQHGFARDMLWQLKSAKNLDTSTTEVVLSLKENAQSLALWPYSFELELTFTIGNTLSVALKTTNTSAVPFTFTQALHTYFAVSDIEQIEVSGLEKTLFVDYADAKKEKSEAESLHIDRMINRVYYPTDAACTLHDPLLKRTIVVEKEGSRSTTVWNPWEENGIHDLPGDTFRNFLCIETTNALGDARTLQPGESHLIVQKVSVNKVDT
jgi:glucose-6-phosphate 1-epimerase